MWNTEYLPCIPTLLPHFVVTSHSRLLGFVSEACFRTHGGQKGEEWEPRWSVMLDQVAFCGSEIKLLPQCIRGELWRLNKMRRYILLVQFIYSFFDIIIALSEMGLPPLFYHTHFVSSFGRLWDVSALLLENGDVIWIEETSFTFS